MAKKGKAKAKKAAANATSSNSLTKKLPLPDPPPVPTPRPSQGLSRKHKPLQPLSESQANRQATPAQATSTCTKMSYRYGAEESAQRLERVGFDPRVTELSPSEFFEQWSKMATIEAHKPQPESANMGPAGPRKRDITIAPLLLSSEFFVENHERLVDLMSATKLEQSGDEQTSSDETERKNTSSQEKQARETNFTDQSTDQSASDEVVSEKETSVGSEHFEAKNCSAPEQPGSLAVASEEGLKRYFPVDTRRYFPEDKGLLGLMQIQELNVSVLEEIFSTGFHNVTALATTSFRLLGLVRELIKILDCTGGVYVDQGAHGTVFVALVPEFSIGDFWRARDRDPCGIYSYNFIKSWCNDAILEESKGLMLLGRIVKKTPSAPKVDEESAALIRHITLDENFFATRRVVSGHADEVYKPDIHREGLGIKNLLDRLYQQKNTVTCVHFDRVPLFDRRLLAIILRGCSQITSVSINSCPLIHVGDLIPILDEINEINRDREAARLPKITTLDFGPAYERGMPFHKKGCSATYGLTWDPIRGDVAQGGLYTILLKAFFKASAMGLRTLFDKECALMRFLLRLPTNPLGIPIFLDACYRIVDLIDQAAGTHDLQMKKAVFDMLQIVRLGIYDEMSLHKSMHWFNDRMMGDCKYCISCGYKMMTAFFYPLNHVSDERVCYGCQLQVDLDRQTHHLREKKMGCLDTLFPDHQPQDIGPEAPVVKNTQKRFRNPVISLQCVSLPSDIEPSCRVDSDGNIVTLNAGKSRRWRQHFRATSLRMLPSLDELCRDDEGAQSRWKKFFDQCEQVDIFRRAIWVLYDQIEQGTLVYTGALRDTLTMYAPRGRPDHYHEHQLPPQDLAMSCTHAQAKKAHLELVNAGEMPGGSVNSLVCGEELDQFERDQQNDFW